MIRLSDGNHPPFQAGMPPSKILVVDDDPVVCEILSRALDSEGFDCHTAATAEEAWSLLNGDGFDLLVLDIRLPGRSGIELLAMAKKVFPELAVIVLTVVDDRPTALRAVKLGAHGYLVKPFEINEVIIQVYSALEHRRLDLVTRDYERRLAQAIRDRTRELRHSQEQIALRLMTALEYRQDETGAHIRRMGLYSEVMARLLGRPPQYAEMLRLAAPMHDLGKIVIPDAVILKPSRLTADEFEVMKTHTTVGARILQGTNIPLLEVAREIALSHHEKWDGSGYPRGLAGPDIPETAQIVAILDVYDALVHDRVYRPAMHEEEALKIIREGKGSQFSPRIFEAFMQALPELRSVRERVGEEQER